MTGKRVYPDEDDFFNLKPGEYLKSKGGLWFCSTPNGMVGTLSDHQVVEHEDGTITVSPSILVRGHEKSWHGYLEKGVWREC